MSICTSISTENIKLITIHISTALGTLLQAIQCSQLASYLASTEAEAHTQHIHTYPHIYMYIANAWPCSDTYMQEKWKYSVFDTYVILQTTIDYVCMQS